MHKSLAPILLVASLILPFSSVLAADKAPQKLTIKVKESKLRAKPKIWAAAVSDLKFGDTLTPLATESGLDADAGWIKVKTKSGVQGFVHPTAVTDRRVILSSSKEAAAEVDPSSVVLAGKGFNREIEQEFARLNPGSNFKQIDQIAAVKISEQELMQFVRAGKLGKGEI